MIKDEYHKLLKLIDESEDLKNINLENILKEAVLFFDELRKTYPAASKEERQEIVRMMTHLHSKMQDISKKIAQSTNMTEEELMAYTENPSNFTGEQWASVQETRRKLYDSAHKFSQALEAEKKAKAPEDKDLTKKAAPYPFRRSTRRTRRSDWTKS